MILRRKEALKDLPDDTDLYVPSIEFSGDLIPVWYVRVDCDGSNGCQAEANILGSD